MRKLTTCALVLSFATALALPPAATTATAKVRIVSSNSDLGSIAQLVAGDLVEVKVIANGKQDPHFVQILPSYMLKVARSDIYLRIGLDLDLWADQIIDGSNNMKLEIVDCSQRIQPLQVPTTRVDASQGDIHVRGNPHYWLDPANGAIIAATIVEALIRVDPNHANEYDAGLQRFQQDLDARIAGWKEVAAPLDGVEIVTYHNSWPYFTDAFGVKVAGFVEPKPGIPPTPSHTSRIIDLVNGHDIKVIAREPFYSDRTPNSIARQTDAVVVELPTSVGGVKGADDYFELFDVILGRLVEAMAR